MKSDTKFADAKYELSGPVLLSQQPSMANEKTPKKEDKEWVQLRAHLETRLNSLFAWFVSWWYQNFVDLSQFMLPYRSIFLTQSVGGIPTPNSMQRGREINQSIVDPTATYAVRICAAGLMSGLASPSRPWFKVSTMVRNFEPDAAGKEWMDEVENRMYKVLAGSNFYQSFALECTDLTVFGTAPVIMYEDAQDLIRFYNPCVGEYLLGTGATLRIDCLNRRYLMTINQIVDFFGLEVCPLEVQKLWQAKGSSLQVEKIIAHSIEPNFGIGKDNAGKIPGNYTWREVYWIYGAANEKPLSMRGFIDQPFTASRVSTQSNDAYGRSWGMDALPDVLQLQAETKIKGMGLEKQANPPLQADAQMKNQPSSSIPGDITYVQNLGAKGGIRSIYDVNPDVQGITADIAQIQARIKTGLLNDLFNYLSEIPEGKMTAYETAQRVQQRLEQAGPVIDNMLGDSLKPKLKYLYRIMNRRGMFPPIPDSMKGIPLDVGFVSLLALAQKAASTGGIERLAAFIGNIAGANPNALDKFNIDNAIDEMGELLGTPQKILYSNDQAAATRQQRAQMQQQQHASAIANQTADTLKTGAAGAQILSNTSIGGGKNALSELLSGGAAAG